MADPISALFGGPVSAGGGGPSGASGGTAQIGFDSSGWAVNFGSGSAGANGGQGLSQWMPYILGGVAVLVVWRMTRKR